MTTSKNSRATSKKATKSPSSINNNLETDMPLSEKDEVKKAEQKTNRPVKRST